MFPQAISENMCFTIFNMLGCVVKISIILSAERVGLLTMKVLTLSICFSSGRPLNRALMIRKVVEIVNQQDN
jgi:hypothetical protein